MPAVIYLDLKDWIGLTRAGLGRPGIGAYGDLFELLRVKVAKGEVIAPLSSTHYIEMSRIKDPKQRAAVALTMGALSQYKALTSRGVILNHQLRQAIAKEFELSYSAPNPPPVGHGFAHAFGQPPVVGRLNGPPERVSAFIEDSGKELVEKLAEWIGFGWTFAPASSGKTKAEWFYEAMDDATQFWMLRGPDDRELPDILRTEYNPQASYDVTERIAAREADLARMLADDSTKHPRLDDIIAARAMYWDLGDEWGPAMIGLGAPLQRLEEIGKEALNRILEDIPIVVVESAIRRGNFRLGRYQWTTNDIYDLSFVGAAVSCSNVVLVDKHVQTQLTHQAIDHRYGVEILRRPEEAIQSLTS